MFIEAAALLFFVILAFLFFGHAMKAPAGFIVGGSILILLGVFLAATGLVVQTGYAAQDNYTAPFTWNYNTTYNFSTFTPSNTTRNVTNAYTEAVGTFPLAGVSIRTFWLILSLIGIYYIYLGLVTQTSKPGQ